MLRKWRWHGIGKRGMQKASFREVMRPEIAEAISQAEKHYRQWGLRHQAEIIRTSPWLRFLWAAE